MKDSSISLSFFSFPFIQTKESRKPLYMIIAICQHAILLEPTIGRCRWPKRQILQKPSPALLLSGVHLCDCKS